VAAVDKLIAAKSTVDDEFYTPMDMLHDFLPALFTINAGCLQGAHVHLPCDSSTSAFTQYFYANFDSLGLRKLTALCYSSKQAKLPGFSDSSALQIPAQLYTKTAQGTNLAPVQCDGSWQGKLGQQLLRQADFVCTNPPFSHTGIFVNWLLLHGKAFCVMAPMLAAAYAGIWQSIVDGGLHIGTTKLFNAANGKKHGIFVAADGSQRDSNFIWLSTLPVPVLAPPYKFTVRWHDSLAAQYPFYVEPHNHIRECGSVTRLPLGYGGLLGIPVNFVHIQGSPFDIVGSIKAGLRGGKVKGPPRLVIRQRSAINRLGSSSRLLL